MEKIFSDIKSSVGSAVKKSGEILEITKLKMAIAETKGELKAKFAALGELAYKEQKSGDTLSLETLVAEIDELREVLEAQESKLISLKKQKVCPNCEAKSDIDAAYCSRCGEKLAEEPAEDEDEPEFIKTVEIVNED